MGNLQRAFRHKSLSVEGETARAVILGFARSLPGARLFVGE